MAVDRNKLQQNADKLVRQGKIDQAISVYEQLLEDSPRDMNLKNKVGDLLVRAGSVPGAVKVFTQVADFYADEGFYLKAIAVCKKINRLDPSAVTVHLTRSGGGFGGFGGFGGMNGQHVGMPLAKLDEDKK